MPRGDHVDPKATARVAIRDLTADWEVQFPEEIRDCVGWLRTSPPYDCIISLGATGGLRLFVPASREGAERERFFRMLATRPSALDRGNQDRRRVARALAATWRGIVREGLKVTIPEPVRKLDVLPGPKQRILLVGFPNEVEVWPLAIGVAQIQSDISFAEPVSVEDYMDDATE